MDWTGGRGELVVEDVLVAGEGEVVLVEEEEEDALVLLSPPPAACLLGRPRPKEEDEVEDGESIILPWNAVGCDGMEPALPQKADGEATALLTMSSRKVRRLLLLLPLLEYPSVPTTRRRSCNGGGGAG